MKDALILGRTNGVGLDRDADLLAGALAGEEFSSRSPAVGGLRPFFTKGGRAEAAFHLERVWPLWKSKADLHFLIPNQERFPERHLGRLRSIDHILCKSRHAAEIFSRAHPSVHFTGFTSHDRLLSGARPDYGRFFHLAGKSTFKNTALLLELWGRHPEWPLLTVVQHPDNAPKSAPPNVDLVCRYLADAELRELQNHCGIHLCPSLAEGWGHYIAEALSCRALTLVTDAPPMNEIVGADRGFLVPFHRSEPRRLGRIYEVDPVKLDAAIAGLIALPVAEKQELGEAGRQWFEQNDREFRRRLGQVLATACAR